MPSKLKLSKLKLSNKKLSYNIFNIIIIFLIIVIVILLFQVMYKNNRVEYFRHRGQTAGHTANINAQINSSPRPSSNQSSSNNTHSGNRDHENISSIRFFDLSDEEKEEYMKKLGDKENKEDAKEFYQKLFNYNTQLLDDLINEMTKQGRKLYNED